MFFHTIKCYPFLIVLVKDNKTFKVLAFKTVYIAKAAQQRNHELMHIELVAFIKGLDSEMELFY